MGCEMNLKFTQEQVKLCLEGLREKALSLSTSVTSYNLASDTMSSRTAKDVQKFIGQAEELLAIADVMAMLVDKLNRSDADRKAWLGIVAKYQTKCKKALGIEQEE